MDSRTIHQFQNYSSSWHSYWLLGCIHRSSCCIYKWSAPRVRTFVYRSKSNTSNTQTVDWIIHPNPNPSHLYPTCIPYIYICPIYPWYPHVSDPSQSIGSFFLFRAAGKNASSEGFVTKTSTARITRSVHRKAAKWLSKRKSVTASVDGRRWQYGGRWVSEECWNEIHRIFFIFDGPNHVVSPLALRVSCGSDASWCAILRKKWVPPSQHRGAFQSAGSSNLSKASFLQRATVPSLLVTWLNSKPKAWQAFSFKFAKNGVKSYGIWQRIHQTFWIIISLTYTT